MADRVETRFEIRKTDEERRLVFGWANVPEQGGALVVDGEEDVIEPEELERAAYAYVLESRDASEMHEQRGVGRIVETIFFSKAKQEALGIDLGRVGWWVGFRVDDDEVWKAVKARKYRSFSIGGRARRVEV